jgi:hypothetical protein
VTATHSDGDPIARDGQAVVGSGRPRKMQVVVLDVARVQRRPQIDTRYSSLCLKRGIVPKVLSPPRQRFCCCDPGPDERLGTLKDHDPAPTFLPSRPGARGRYGGQRPRQRVAECQEGFRFRSGIDLVNVIATVTDRSGRFVAGLRQADFTVYDDNEAVEVTHFSNERVPVSFGIELVTSGSMAGDKIASARAAIDRFLDQLLNPDDHDGPCHSSPHHQHGWERPTQCRRAPSDHR